MSDGAAFEFPCSMSIKVVGRWAADLEDHVLALARRHAAGAELEPDRARTSRAGLYLALTLEVRLDDRAQLDALYEALARDARVLWAL